MPTGYTAPVQSGEITDFPTFAMLCARAFGALVTLRDDMKSEIPEAFEPDAYYAERVSNAYERLSGLMGLSEDEIARRCTEANEKAAMELAAFRARREEQAGRYRAMLAKVLAWEPPTPDHSGLKAFMVEQLETSLAHDCDGWEPDATPVTPREWYEVTVAAARREVASAEESMEEETQRCAGRTEWIRALRQSLADPALTEG